MSENKKYILILKAIHDDKRLEYIVSRKLFDLWPETPFAQWKSRVSKGETIILMRAENIIEFDRVMREMQELHAPLEIVDQKNIGGASVF
ncbi:MAG: hypothetical protein C0402_01690 [Thermodesulfovibrio sp.]|nr:hypothetical protein [Thermodesulfovibrio sp.]